MKRLAMFAIFAGALVLSACGGGSSAPAGAPSGKATAPGVLRVSVWGGDYQKEEAKIIGDVFTKQTGVKVEYVAGNPSDSMAKVRAARGSGAPIDVISLSDTELTHWKDSDLLANLDYGALPATAKVAGALKLPKAVAMDQLMFGLVYNTDKFKQLGLPAPTSFADLFNPKLAGHVALPRSAVDWAPFVSFEAAGSATDLAPGFAKLRQLKTYYVYPSSADLATKFTAGDVWAAPWQSSYVFRLNNQGFPVAFVPLGFAGRKYIPLLDWYSVAAGSTAKDLAWKYINLALDVPAQVERAKWGVFEPTNPDAEAQVASDPKLQQLMPPDLTADTSFVPDWVAFYRGFDGWVKQYDAAVSGSS